MAQLLPRDFQCADIKVPSLQSMRQIDRLREQARSHRGMRSKCGSEPAREGSRPAEHSPLKQCESGIFRLPCRILRQLAVW